MFYKYAKALVGAAMATSIMAFVASPASAITIEVSQETSVGLGDFNSNVLGFINPYNTPLTAGQFYQYNSPRPFSYNGQLNGGPVPVNRKTQLFFVNASNGLGFFMVHDRPNDGSGGNASMTFNLSGDTANIAGDDPGEVSGGGTLFNANHNWGGCCTDGARIGALDGIGWTLFAKFNSRPTGINGWGAVDNSGVLAFSGPNTTPNFNNSFGRQVRFRPVAGPGTLALFGLGLAGLGFARRKRMI